MSWPDARSPFWTRVGPWDDSAGVWANAYRINNAGQVVGELVVAGSRIRAFLYSDGHMRELGTLGGRFSSAFGINNNGEVVGYAETSSCENHAFLYRDGRMHDIGNFTPSAINDRGQIVGWSDRLLLYSNGLITELSGAAAGAAHDMNNKGEIVGLLGEATPGRAFLYSDGKMIDLGTLGGSIAVARGINDTGQMVGSANTVNNDAEHGFLYEGGKMFDLNELIESSGWIIVFAFEINKSGDIAAWGYRWNDIDGQTVILKAIQ